MGGGNARCTCRVLTPKRLAAPTHLADVPASQLRHSVLVIGPNAPWRKAVKNPLSDLSQALADAVENAGRNVVAVHEGGRSGVSGTLWRDNLVVTAAHTIHGLKHATLTLPDGTPATAEVVGSSPRLDLALLKLSASAGSSAKPADPATLRVGQIVLAIGRRGNGILASHGIISALRGSRGAPGSNSESWLRLDLQPYTGFSGGPLIDVEGRIIGINTSGPRRNVLTIPAASVERTVSILLAKGRIPNPYLGVGLQPVHLPAGLQGLAGSKRALLVVMVEPGGPAEKAGLLLGDVLAQLDGEPVNTAGDLQQVLDPENIGRVLRLRVLRGGTQHDVNLVVGEREA